MHKDELARRQKFIQATPLPDRSGHRKHLRKALNYLPPEEPHENDTYESFFDFDEDIAGLKSAGEQFQAMESIQTLEEQQEIQDYVEETLLKPVTMERIEAIQEKFQLIPASGPNGYVMLEDLDEAQPERIKPFSGPIPEDPGFKFIQCAYTKPDGQKCKRQAPKNHEFCSAHRKLLEKDKK